MNALRRLEILAQGLEMTYLKDPESLGPEGHKALSLHAELKEKVRALRGGEPVKIAPVQWLERETKKLLAKAPMPAVFVSPQACFGATARHCGAGLAEVLEQSRASFDVSHAGLGSVQIPAFVAGCQCTLEVSFGTHSRPYSKGDEITVLACPEGALGLIQAKLGGALALACSKLGLEVGTTTSGFVVKRVDREANQRALVGSALDLALALLRPPADQSLGVPRTFPALAGS